MFSQNSGSIIQNHFVLIPSATKKYMSENIPYVFRQNSDFLYLTGCLESDSALILQIDENDKMESILFMRPKNAMAEIWDGSRTGIENSVDLFGVDEAYDICKIKHYIQETTLYLPKRNQLIWYALPI